jgi:hypothetical protein
MLAQDFLQNEIRANSEGRIRLVNFTKTDDKTVNYGGSEGYVLVWRAEIEFLEDCLWPVSDNLLQTQLSAAGDDLKNNFHKQGERALIKGKYHIEKTEKGWNVTGREFLPD